MNFPKRLRGAGLLSRAPRRRRLFHCAALRAGRQGLHRAQRPAGDGRRGRRRQGRRATSPRLPKPARPASPTSATWTTAAPPNRCKAFPQAKYYKDWRKMLDKEAKHIDAVSVSTPDHNHAITTLAAMQLGKHVYVQKPLTHDIYEARALTDAAKRYKVVTQMGNQGASNDGVRPAARVVRRRHDRRGAHGVLLDRPAGVAPGRLPWPTTSRRGAR
ncbi:MAG: Gfo/Idh/MocA family oxidoreductase [Hymenobacter sp.]